MENLENIKQETQNAIKELIQISKLKANDILVVGCSTSEVSGNKIGTASSTDVAEAIFDGLIAEANKAGVFVAVQCCEHLNRAIVVSKQAVPFSEIVNVVPAPKAGGALATIAYQKTNNAVVVEFIKADAGIDIGGTLIGMHLKPVAVPVRLQTKKIGEANIIAARTRPKFIGGARAGYNENLL